MEIGQVSVGVGYTLDQSGPRRFQSQQAALATSTARFQTALGRLANRADDVQDELRSVNTASDRLRRSKEDLNRTGLRTVNQLEEEVVRLRRLQRAFQDDARLASTLESRIASLNREIAASVQPVEGFTSAQEQLNRIGIRTTQQIEEQVTELGRLRAAFAQDDAAVREIDNRLSTLNARLGNTGGASRTATNAIIQLGRGVEDASFGFIGVANNIPVILEGFGRLRLEAQATGTSFLKSLGGALLGPAGLIFAFQAATFAIITFGDDIKRAFRSTSQSILDDSKKVRQELEELISVSDDRVVKFDIESPEQARAAIRGLQSDLQIAQDLANEAQQAATDAAFAVGTANVRGDQAAIRAAEERSRLANDLLTVRQQDVRILEEGLKLVEEETQALEDQLAISRRLAQAGLTPEQDSGTGGGRRQAARFDVETVQADFDQIAGLADELAGRLVNPVEAAQQEWERILRQPLPPLNTQESEDAFDRYAVRLAETTRAASFGVITEQEAINEELQATTALLRALSDEGIPLTSSAYDEYRQRLAELNEAQATFNAQAEQQKNQISDLDGVLGGLQTQTLALGEAFFTTFTDAVTGVRRLEDALKGLQNILRRTLSRLLSAGLTAGLGSALGFGGFGQLFGQALGFSGGPQLAEGGIVTRTTSAIVGEAGPEAVVPLERIQPIIDTSVRRALTSMQETTSTTTQPVFSQPDFSNLRVTVDGVQAASGVREGALNAQQLAGIRRDSEMRFAFDPVVIGADQLWLLLREANRLNTQNHGLIN